MMPGAHKIDVTYEGLNVPRSPFTVNVTPGCDPSRVKAYGPGGFPSLISLTNHWLILSGHGGRMIKTTKNGHSHIIFFRFPIL